MLLRFLALNLAVNKFLLACTLKYNYLMLIPKVSTSILGYISIEYHANKIRHMVFMYFELYRLKFPNTYIFNVLLSSQTFLMC